MPRVDLSHPATYADLEAVPDILVAEIVDGDLWTSPRPGPLHARSGASLVATLSPQFDLGHMEPGGWLILYEPELHLGDNVIVPDIAGWRRRRMPALPDTAYFAVAPDWICEVLSPSTEPLDRGAKMRIYAEHGVDHAWLVDPVKRIVEVYRRDAQAWVSVAAHEGRVSVPIPPFESLHFDVGLLWG